MADHTDHLDEQGQSRPFLASTEAHQATLMKEVKKHGQSPAPADDPAPMLPPIMNHAATDLPSSDKESNDSGTSSSSHPTSLTQARESDNRQTESLEADNSLAASYYPNSRRIVAGAVASLVALIGFSAVWFSANQDIYTLGNSEDGKLENTSKAAGNPSKPQATQPATLGAETGSNKAAALTLNNLPALTQGFYHMWIKQGENTTSLGQFSINDNGQASTSNNQAFIPQLKADQSDAMLLISIETTEDPSQPSSSIILSGQLKDGKASLSFTAIDLSQASGVYTIAAPTDLSGENQSSGVWFAKTDGHSLTAAGLAIPNAPEGWKYEAQLAYKDQVIAAGRFNNPNDRDDFGVFTPNPDQTPSFPGEDYLQGAPSRLGIDFPANLTSGEWKIIISIEPDQNSSDPTGDDVFFLQPFIATIAEGAENYKEYPLSLNISKFPTATFSLK